MREKVLSNIADPIFVGIPSNTTSFKLIAPAKTLSSMILTDAGILMEISPDPAKAPFPMRLTLSGITTSCNGVASNTPEGISLIELEMMADFILVALKA